jgi:hypothetical protein
MRAKGIDKAVDVSTICQTAGISRKTGYQWADRYVKSPEDSDDQIENEGRKLAWDIHGVDEMLRSKKNTTGSQKSKKR